MISPAAFLADASLPEPLAQRLDTAHSTGIHLSPAFVMLAAGALALVAYLVWDVVRQKREEKRQRDRLERFREKKFGQAQRP